MRYIYSFLRMPVVFITVSTFLWEKLQRCLILHGLLHFLVVCHWLAFFCFGDPIGSLLSCEGRHDVTGSPRRRRVQSDRAFKASPSRNVQGGLVRRTLPKRRQVALSRGTNLRSAIEKLGKCHSDTAQMCVLFGVNVVLSCFKLLSSARTLSALR